MEVIEGIAVAFSAAYVVLAIYGQRACWIAGGIGSALYVVVFHVAGFPLQSALQLVYVPLAVYGWVAWNVSKKEAPPAPWPVLRHLVIVTCVIAATAVSAPVLARWGASAAPVAESLGTWGSVAATWLVARRCLEAWLWWIVIDAGLAALFYSQGLVPTAALYLAFTLLAVAGWRNWLKDAGRP